MMPYRIDVALREPGIAAATFDRLVDLGALDVEALADGIAAIMPDSVALSSIEDALGSEVRATPARGRDDGSVWVVRPRPLRIGRLQILPADRPAEPGAVRLLDESAFGTGLHATTALCLDVLDAELNAWAPDRMLDVGTGSGVLALAALARGVRRAVGIDIDADAIRTAAANARLNALTSQLALARAGPEALGGAWPLVFANVLASPLIEMAPALARCVGRSGRLILSGIHGAVAADVDAAYRRLGMRQVGRESREGWTALTFHASW
jgi:ribosomal protein L11 methyltransferase